MINLIPSDAVRIVRKEYIARVLCVWAIILAFSFGASAFTLLPTYVLVAGQLRVTDAASAVEENAHAMATEELASAQAIAERLRVTRDAIAASAILTHIEAALTPQITLRSLMVSPDGVASQIQVVGSAVNREALQRFTGSLKADPFFENASVPVSDLARETDLSFTLTLVLAAPAS